MSLLIFLAQGGPVMGVLVVLSVITTAIVAAKLMHFSKLRLRRGQPALDECVRLICSGEYGRAEAMLATNPNPVGRVIASTLTCLSNENMAKHAVDIEISRVGTIEIRNLESWLRALASIAHLSPLVGLLGTVTGMIQAFMQIQTAGPSVDPSVLSGGIWQALLTTAAGLSIAIPAMAAFHLLEGEVDRVNSVMRDRSQRLRVHFEQLANDAGSPGDAASGACTRAL